MKVAGAVLTAPATDAATFRTIGAAASNKHVVCHPTHRWRLRFLPFTNQRAIRTRFGTAVGAYAALCLGGRRPASSEPQPASPQPCLLNMLPKCDLDDIALRQSRSKLSLTGAGCIFHLDLFHPEFLTKRAGRSCPQLRPTYSSNSVFGSSDAQRTLLDRPRRWKTVGSATRGSFTNRKRKTDQLVDRSCRSRNTLLL